MGDAPHTATLRERFAGKWQIPALFISSALLLGSILQIKPPEVRLPVAQLMEEMEALYRGGLYNAVLHHGERLLEREKEERTREQTGQVRLYMARAGLQQAKREGRRTPAAARQAIDEFARARRAGITLVAEDHIFLGQAYEWMDEFAGAVEQYEAAIAADPASSLRIRQRVIQLRHQVVATPVEQLAALLDQFIADARERPDLFYWATELKVELLLEMGQIAEARAQVEALRDVFEPLAQREAFEYLLCWIDYRAGRYDEAETQLRALRNRLTIRDETFARSGWLLGRVVLNDGVPQRPEEAISFFDDVVRSQASPLYTGASHLGMAEALAEMHRYDAALDHYNKAIAALRELTPTYFFNRDKVRSSITVVGSRLHRDDKCRLALMFVELAISLVDDDEVELRSRYLEELGDLRAALARSLRDELRGLPETPETASRRAELAAEVRELLLRAGEAFVTLARINTLNDARSGAAAWRAADLFDEGGDRDRTIALLREFVRERPDGPLAPQAWMRLGQSLQALGRFEEAIDVYQECNRRFPRTLHANQSLIPLASCYTALGSEYTDLAEKTLHRILDDSRLFDPRAPEFRDALFMLGDLLNREARYEEAITALEETLERCPDDPRSIRGLFLLADSYQLSGLALEEDLKDARFVGERLRMRRERRRRLERASELYGSLIARYEADDEETLDELDKLYLRHARLYLGDCLFSLQRYEEALKHFERAAWIYKDIPSSLSAYVQIINCHVFLGKVDEARAALRRVQYLVKAIPDDAFEQALAPNSREEWSEYFNWLDESGLF